MQKLNLGEIEIQTEVCYWLMSRTEEVRSWITWLGSTHYVFWRPPGPPATWVLRHHQRTGCWNILAFPLSTCHFSGKSRPGTSTGVGSGHTQKGPHLCSPCLETPHISWSRGPTLLCLTLSFLTGSYKLGSWSWAPSEMLMRKERHPPSFSFLPYQIHKQILMPFPSTCFLWPSISLPAHSPP